MHHVLVYRSRRISTDRLVAAFESEEGPGWSAQVVDSAAALVMAFDQQRPNIALVGLEVENPLGVIDLLRHIDSAVPVLAIGGHDQPRQSAEAITAGARGYICDDSSHAKFLHGNDHSAHASVSEIMVPLTRREKQVLAGMCDGKSNSEIGRELYLSEDTIKTHARRLFRKIGARDRAEAVAIGFRTGLLT